MTILEEFPRLDEARFFTKLYLSIFFEFTLDLFFIGKTDGMWSGWDSSLLSFSSFSKENRRVSLIKLIDKRYIRQTDQPHIATWS